MTDAATPSRPTTFDEMAARQQLMFDPAAIGQALGFQPRSTDVFIAPFAKCGTTWLQQMVHSMRTGGDLDFDDISRVVPWLETSTMLQIELDAEQRAEPRAFKSHLPWDLIPKGARYIVSIRDPKDALVSMYRFMEGWFFEPGSISVEEMARRRFMQRNSMDYWTHLLSWWQQRENPDVLVLVYEHMLQDPQLAMRRVADFLHIRLDESLADIVAEESSFDSMLAHKELYDDLLMRRYSEGAANLPAGSDAAKVRKGKAGSHRSELPGDVIAELDTIWSEVITPATGARDYRALSERLT